MIRTVVVVTGNGQKCEEDLRGSVVCGGAGGGVNDAVLREQFTQFTLVAQTADF